MHSKSKALIDTTGLPHRFGRFICSACRGSYLERLAERYGLTVREVANRMQVTQRRVREVYGLPVVPYGIACDYVEIITGNARTFSPAVADRLRRGLRIAQ